MKKTILSIIFFSLILMSNAQISVWDGSHTIWNTGTGSESDPYLIESAENLAYLAYTLNEGYVTYIDSYFMLTVDIDLNNLPWDPIGYMPNESSAKFRANFDGNNHQIINLNVESDIYAGLFGYVYSSSGIVIKNITIGGNSTISALNEFEYCAGGIIAFAEDEITISNCHNMGTISGYYAGGIVGKYKRFNSSTFCIDSCTNNGNIIDSHYASGIIGFIDASNTDTQVSNCTNFGSIFGNCYIASGIIAIGSKSNISNCCNHGEISTSVESGDIIVGGVFGYMTECVMNYCYNTGNITAYNNNTSSGFCSVGGIIGRSTFRNTLNQCFNTGNISSIHFTNSQLKSYTGGVIGFATQSFNSYPFSSLGSGSSESNIDINNCYNTGTLFSTPNQEGFSNYCTGGIVGFSEGYYLVTAELYVNNSYNVGNLVNGGDKGGIYGGSGSYSWEIIANCYYLDVCGDNTDYDGEAKSESEMKAMEFVNTLNLDTNVWSQDIEPFLNMGYPLFFENNRLPIVNTAEATSISENTVILNGQIFEKNETISTYGFEYKQNSSENGYIQHIATSEFDDLAELITNLESNTIYNFRAFAITESGITYGDTLSFTTLSSVDLFNNDDSFIVSIYPNPFCENIIINYNKDIIQNFSVSIYSQNGSLIYSMQDLNSSDPLLLNNLQPGTYTLVIDVCNEYIKAFKIIKTN